MATTTAAGTTDQQSGNLLELERQVCFALSVASRGVVAIYRPILESMGLTHPQYLVMLALWQHQPLTVKRLGELLQLEPATLSPLLKRLEASDLVTRQRDPEDERALRLTLTAKGKGLRNQALKVPETVMAQLGMSLAELTDLNRVLSHVIEQAKRANPAFDRRTALPS